MEREYLSAKDMQVYLGLGRNVVYEILNRQDFPAVRIGRTIRVKRTELDKWLVVQQTSKNTEAK
jgi:excisionase family DNA binding protein